jgi:hypothetical protein
VSSNSWTAVFTNRRGGEVRFPLVEDERGKLFLKINGETIPYQIGLNDSEHGTLIHFRTERIAEQEKHDQKQKLDEEK